MTMSVIHIHFLCSEFTSLEAIIQTLNTEVINDDDDDNSFHLTIRRSHALTDALDLIDLCDERDLFQRLKVSFIGESAVDDGGPSRGMASLLVIQCQSSYLMEGTDVYHQYHTKVY